MAYIGSKPANKPVVASDLDPTIITGQTALAVAPADTDEFLISDAGVLKRLDASLIGGGKVLQVLTATDSTNRATTSTSFGLHNSTLTVNITPSSTSSKILVFLSCMLYIASSSSRLAIFRDDVNLADDAEDSHSTTDGDSAYYGTSGMHVLDSPSSTSQITYQVRFKSNSGTSTTLTNQGAKGNITVIEIGA